MGPREQRRGAERHAGLSHPQGRALSGCLPIWKQYCSNVRRPGYGIFSEYVNSTVRNMDLMDNLTSSQKNPDSSPGLHPALGFHCSPAQPGASSAVAVASRNGADPGSELTSSLMGWEWGIGDQLWEQHWFLSLNPVYGEESEVGESKTLAGGRGD